MTLSNAEDDALLVGIVDFGRVDVLAEIRLSDLSALLDGVLRAITSNEGIHDLVANLQSLMFLPAIAWELPCGIADDPEVVI